MFFNPSEKFFRCCGFQSPCPLPMLLYGGVLSPHFSLGNFFGKGDIIFSKNIVLCDLSTGDSKLRPVFRSMQGNMFHMSLHLSSFLKRFFRAFLHFRRYLFRGISVTFRSGKPFEKSSSQGVADENAFFAPLTSKISEKFFDAPDFLAYVLVRDAFHGSNLYDTDALKDI